VANALKEAKIKLESWNFLPEKFFILTFLGIILSFRLFWIVKGTVCPARFKGGKSGNNQ
jgi:hypothetical protein